MVNLWPTLALRKEKIKEAEEKGKGAIDLCTLRNHLKKIPQIESSKAFYEHLKILRNKRWVRGYEYVADGVDLEVRYGKTLRRYSKEGKEKDLGKVNAALIYDKKDGRMRRRIYVTTLDAEKDPLRIYRLYKDRWTIENQEIRYLSQRWSLRDLAGRTLNSIQARIFTILILYNAVKILQMKYEDKMEKLQDEMRERGELSYLSGSVLIVYGRDNYYGIFSGVEYANLVAKRTAKVTAKTTARATAKSISTEIARKLEKMLAEKDSKEKIAGFIKELKQG